jgi:diguanylate cyclase (GGDEF)-like protein
LKNIIYFALFTSCLFGLNYGFFKRDYFIVSTSSILIILLNYFKPKIDDFLYNIFLKKYKTIWNNLKEAGKISHNIYETKAIIDILVIDIPKALNIENAVYYSLDESNQKYSMYQTNQENKRIEAISLENILAKQLTEKRQFMYVNYLDNKDVISVLEEMNIELCYPIFYQDILNGILVYGKKQDKSLFNNEELTLLSETIEKAEIQINNIIKISHISSNYAEELLKKYKNTNQKMLLNETKRLSEIRDIDLLCEHSKKVVNRLLNVKDVEIFLYDRVNKKDYVSTNGTEEIRVNEDNYLVKYLIQTNEIVATADLKKWAEESKLKDLKEAVEMAEKIKARFVIPLTDKKLLGFLIVDNKFESLEYTQDDFVFLSVIKNTLEITIRNIYLNEKSQKDPLTKLYNRNFLDARLEEEIIQGFRECVPVSYLMIDGDSFKKFNDENGHDAGDKVLIEIASCIKTTIRPSDEVCRYGGEEFSVICTGTKNDGAVMLGNRINEAFRVNPNILKLNEMYGKKITVSIGVSTFHNKDSRTQYSNQEIMDYCQKLKNKGDEAMYEAKRLGKDRSYNGGEFEKI